MGKPGRAAQIHCSVLLKECMELLNPQSGATYVDGTLGLGGHTEAILQQSSPAGKVIGFDWDAEAIEKSSKRLEEFGERLTIVRRNFSEICQGLAETGIETVDGILIDIGLSSLQLDNGERGFSFQRDEPLDMRMDSRGKVTAALLVAKCSEKELADIFYYYGEEKQARRIAAHIVNERVVHPIETSAQLASLVAKAIPRRFYPKRKHVATLVFQALRMAVNTELENLSQILKDGVSHLKPGGRFCVISFHSLEDRMVKRRFRENELLHVVTRKPVMASIEEKELNPRSRSARLRVAERI